MNQKNGLKNHFFSFEPKKWSKKSLFFLLNTFLELLCGNVHFQKELSGNRRGETKSVRDTQRSSMLKYWRDFAEDVVLSCARMEANGFLCLRGTKNWSKKSLFFFWTPFILFRPISYETKSRERSALSRTSNNTRINARTREGEHVSAKQSR